MLPITQESIDYSVDFDGDLEDFQLFDNEITEEQLELLIKKVIKDHHLIVGERSTGEIIITEETIEFSYQYCAELGEEEIDDVWEDEKFSIPNDI